MTENQLREIAAAGFKVEPRRVVSETVAGSSSIEQRHGFCRLLDRPEQDDVLVVTKFDRLGRTAIDVTATVERLAKMGIELHCQGVDLKSAAGRTGFFKSPDCHGHCKRESHFAANDAVRAAAAGRDVRPALA